MTWTASLDGRNLPGTAEPGPIGFAPPAGISVDLLSKAVERPGRAITVLWALGKGHLCKLVLPLLGHRFKAGRNLRVFGRLDLRGPGEVILGDNATVLGHTTPWTYTREARIVIGDNVIIGDTRFGCVAEISIGHDCMLANASIQDTDFHSTHVNRRLRDAPIRVAPVRIGNNVWVAQFAAILPGARIGRNSVVGFGTVCAREYPDNVIIIGHPGRVAGPVPGTGPGPAPATSSISHGDAS